MALKKTLAVQDQFGGEHIVQDAYIQVSSVSGDKLAVSFNYFIKKSDKINVVDRRSDTFAPSMDVNAGNFIKQAYDFLKSKPEYADAADC